MGQTLLLAGILCMAAAAAVFVAYLVLGKGAGQKLKKQLQDEY